jgi:FkbM family methyltransferase
MKIRAPYWDQLVARIIGKLQRAIGIGSGALDCANEVNAISYLLERAGRKSSVGMFVLDIGGNLGDWTYEANKRWPGSDFVIFEPSATALTQLRNRFSSAQNIKIIAQAISDTVGKAKLFSDAPGSGLGSLSQRDLTYLGINFSYEETVQVDTLDNYLFGTAKSVSILKIDVEGHELSVLQGATDLFASDRKPTIVQFEFGGACIDTKIFFRDLWKFFEDYEYDFFRIGKNKLHQMSKYKEEYEIFKTTNIIAVSKAR